MRHHRGVSTQRFLHFLRSLARRRSLARGLAGCVLALLAVWLIPSRLSAYSRAIIAWDVGLAVFFLSMWRVMRNLTVEELRDWSCRLQAGRRTVLALNLIAATAALLSVFEMKVAKDAHGAAQAVRIIMVIATVALSWFFVQTVFAVDYAHEYYAKDEAGGDRGGLQFPGGEAPDFWDFLHFAVIIGATAQTADISIVSKPLRRLATIHSLIAFSFNAVILALTINLTAGLMG